MIKAFHVFSIGFFFVAVLGCEPGRNIDFYRRGHLPPGGSQKQGALGSIGMTLVGFESFETSERSEMSISLYLYSRTRQQQDLLAEWVLVAKDRKVLQKGEGSSRQQKKSHIYQQRSAPVLNLYRYEKPQSLASL
jgi:hypothetical protein